MRATNDRGGDVAALAVYVPVSTVSLRYFLEVAL